MVHVCSPLKIEDEARSKSPGPGETGPPRALTPHLSASSHSELPCVVRSWFCGLHRNKALLGGARSVRSGCNFASRLHTKAHASSAQPAPIMSPVIGVPVLFIYFFHLTLSVLVPFPAPAALCSLTVVHACRAVSQAAGRWPSAFLWLPFGFCQGARGLSCCFLPGEPRCSGETC